MNVYWILKTKQKKNVAIRLKYMQIILIVYLCFRPLLKNTSLTVPLKKYWLKFKLMIYETMQNCNLSYRSYVVGTMLSVLSVSSSVDLKSQPDPSPILSQLTQQQNSTLLSDLPAQGRNPSPPLPLQDMSSSVLKPPGDTSAPTISESHQPKQIRPQRRRMPPPSKVRVYSGYVDV